MAARNNTVWNKVKEKLAEQGETILFDILKAGGKKCDSRRKSCFYFQYIHQGT
ncbi:hypothetical protein JOD24_000401 [Kroppenstedtia sanguinis]